MTADAGGGSDAATRGLGFTASNFPASKLEEALASPELGDLDLYDCGPQLRTGGDGGQVRLGCEAPGTKYRVIDSGVDGTPVVFVARSIRVREGFTLHAIGRRSAMLVARENIDLSGGIEVEPGQVGTAMPENAQHGAGPGGGKGSGSSTAASGGGGSFCGRGGSGGAPSAAAGEPYGTPELVPLVAGSHGGAPFAGKGGGAIQLVAGGEIVVRATAFIDAPGTGGGQGGGGSGGAVLLEAPSVRIEGTVTANSGGGGVHCGQSGEDGKRSAAVALGACKADPVSGGDGAAGTQIDGTNGVAKPGTPENDYSGSGGGGAGRIRINTRSGSATITGLVSPALSTPCATQGTLR